MGYEKVGPFENVYSRRDVTKGHGLAKPDSGGLYYLVELDDKTFIRCIQEGPEG